MKYEMQRNNKTKRSLSLSPSIKSQSNNINEESMNIPSHSPLSHSSFPPVLNSLIYQSPLLDIHHQRNSLFTQKNSQSSSISFKKLSPTSKAFHSSFTKFLPKKSKKNVNKKTLLLDLDETLVHSSFELSKRPPDITLTLKKERRTHTIFVLVRPGVELFLEKMHLKYELVIFTASISNYANPLIDMLDKKKRISHRLFRENCTFTSNGFIKDLQQLNRDLKDVIMLDNSPASYSFSKSNGFPISTWIDDKEDRELLRIIPVLNYLAKVYDVRSYITYMNEHNDFSLTRASELVDEANNGFNNNSNGSNNIIPQITNLRQIIEASNESTEREGEDAFLNLNRNEKKYSINIVNNNYLQVYLNADNNNHVTTSNLNGNSNCTQLGLNNVKLQKIISQYKTMAHSRSREKKTENDDSDNENELKPLAFFNLKKLNGVSNKKLNSIIKKSAVKNKPKRLFEIDSFKSISVTTKLNNRNIGNNNNGNRSIEKNTKYIPSSYQLTPMMNMNQTNKIKPKMIKYNIKKSTAYSKGGFLDDPFLKQGWSTSRSGQTVIKSRSCSNFNVPSSMSHKLKFGILLRNTSQSKL